jgi:hypothetical protein
MIMSALKHEFSISEGATRKKAGPESEGAQGADLFSSSQLGAGSPDEAPADIARNINPRFAHRLKNRLIRL